MPALKIIAYSSLEKFPDAVELMAQNMERLKSEGELEYYDFSQDSEFIKTYEYFTDTNHLNAYGAEKFSWKLWSVLRKSGFCSGEDFVTDISQ